MNRKGLAGLFDSKRFWVVLGSLVVILLTARFPEYANKIDLIVQVVVALAFALIGGYTLQDTVTAWSNRPGSLSDALRALLEEFIGAGGLNTKTLPKPDANELKPPAPPAAG